MFTVSTDQMCVFINHFQSSKYEYIRIQIFFIVYSVLGGVLIICGLYTVLWGKGKEAQKKSDNIEPQEIMEDYEPTRPLLSPW